MVLKRRRVPIYLVAVLGLFIAGYPFVFMIQTALKSQGDFLADPLGFSRVTLENLELVLTPEFMRFFLNSVVVSAVSVSAAVLFGAMASYPLAMTTFRFNRRVFLFFVAGLMIPIHVTIIPVFVLTQQLGLYDSILALIGPYVGFSLPITVFILTEFFRHVPREIVEAAMIDGAGHFRVFFRIMLPLARPALTAVAIYNLIFVWNEFIFALVLTTSPENMTLPLGLREFIGQFSVNVPAMMMAITLASLPVLLFYVLAQEKVVEGFTAGAVQG